MRPDRANEQSQTLLREQVFTNPGAVDWIRAERMSPQMPPWLLLVAIFTGLLALVAAMSLSIHRQVETRLGTVTPGSVDCPAEGETCHVELIMTHRPEYLQTQWVPGTDIDIVLADHFTVRGTVLKDRSDQGSRSRLIVALPKPLASISGRVKAISVKERSLVAWVRPNLPNPELAR